MALAKSIDRIDHRIARLKEAQAKVAAKTREMEKQAAAQNHEIDILMEHVVYPRQMKQLVKLKKELFKLSLGWGKRRSS